MLDGYIIHDPRLEPAFTLSSAVLTEEDNTPAKFEFVMPYGHVGYNNIVKMKSLIEVYKDGALLFSGRPRDDSRDFDNSKTVTCEGDLSYFYDSVVRPYAYNGTVEGYLEALLDSHNEQVDADRQIQLGELTAADPDDYITRSSSAYPDTFAELIDKCVEEMGGHFLTRHEEGVTWLDYLADSTSLSLQTIELGSNLLDLWQENRSAELYTAIIPLGARIKAEEGEDDEADVDKRVTIESVNDSKDYLYNQDAVDAYGWIFATQYWNDVYEPSDLKTKGAARLSELITGWSSLEVTAFDLSLIDKSMDDFRFFDYVQITSEPHGVDTKALIRQKTTDLLSPENSKLVVGKEKKGMTDFVSNAGRRVETIERNYVVNEQITNVVNDVHNVSSIIAQMPDSIIASVNEQYMRQTERQEIIDEMSAQLSLTADELLVKFGNLETTVTDQDTNTQAQFNESSNYLRFDGATGEVEIGKSGNPMVVRIGNDQMTFYDNETPVAYISDNKLWITEADIDQSLQIGSLVFINRVNNHLSLVKGA
jgi:hypothetical protein